MKIYHVKADKKAGEYIVWNETGRNPLNADGKETEKCSRFALDYYTKDEYSETADELIDFFGDYDDICVSLDVIDYEEDTGFHHYAFTAEAV